MHLIKPTWLTHGGPYDRLVSHKHPSKTTNCTSWIGADNTLQERKRTLRSTVAMFRQTVLDWLPQLEVSWEISECDLCMRSPSLPLQDGYVRIWSTEAIYRADEASFNKPRQLASMSYHSGTIHTVRFSPTGRYVASGADDKIVCIYILDPNPPSHSSTFGTLPYPAQLLDTC
jgi:WD40 repeat protein